MVPMPFLGYYPALVPQTELDEAVTLLDTASGKPLRRIAVGPPAVTEPLAPRDNYDTADPVPLESFGPTTLWPLSAVVLGRSGDKGANVNLGLFVDTPHQFDWLRSFMTRDKLKELMRDDWRDWYFVKRVELPTIFAVHFVVYGPWAAAPAAPSSSTTWARALPSSSGPPGSRCPTSSCTRRPSSDAARRPPSIRVGDKGLRPSPWRHLYVKPTAGHR